MEGDDRGENQFVLVRMSVELVEQLRGGVEVERARLSVGPGNVLVVEITQVADSQEVGV